MGKIILNGAEYRGGVSDVEVNGSSVVNAQGVAEITVPDELSELAEDSTHRTVTDTEKSTWSAKVSDNPTFTEASTRANIASGESFATILGKIKKFFTDLKTVAFSGSYNDLSDKPTIPSAQVNSDWNANSGVAQILNKPSLATVATSGKSSDLNNDAGFITSAGSCAYATSAGTATDNTKVAKTGDTMTGNLNLEGTPSDSTELWMSIHNNGVIYGNVIEPQTTITNALVINTLPSDSGTLALTSQIPSDILYAHYASTSNMGSVVVTHPELASTDGYRANLYAYGNGNGYPWFMEIIYAYSYVRCISINKTVDVGVRYIDSTHFAIISNFWDRVIVCGNENNFSVATSSTSYTIDTSSTRLPMPDRTVYTNTSQTGLTIKRVGKVVTIFISRSDTLSTSGITIPTGYRPPTDLYFIGKAYVNDSGYDTWSQGFRIETDGKLTARATDNNSSITVSWISASVTYITEQDYPS